MVWRRLRVGVVAVIVIVFACRCFFFLRVCCVVTWWCEGLCICDKNSLHETSYIIYPLWVQMA